jgi:hypothetical protein
MSDSEASLNFAYLPCITAMPGSRPIAPWTHPVFATLDHPLYAARKEGNCKSTRNIFLLLFLFSPSLRAA